MGNKILNYGVLCLKLFFLGVGLGTVRFGTITCASSNGREPESSDSGVKRVDQLLDEKRRAELSGRIASGEFTVKKSGYGVSFHSLGLLWLEIIY